MNNNPFPGDPKVKFPVNFDLKVIMENTRQEDISKSILQGLLEGLNIPHSNWFTKFSSHARYISLSVNITLDCQNQMDLLYQALKAEPSVRVAI